MLREYKCPNCGFEAWALERILETKCFKCGAPVKTTPVPVSDDDKSFVCNSKDLKKNSKIK